MGDPTLDCGYGEPYLYFPCVCDAGNSEHICECYDNHRLGDSGESSAAYLSGESNEPGADTEASTRASRAADGGGIDVEDGEGGSGSQGNHGDLIPTHRLARNDIGGDGDGETLQNILDQAGKKVAHINTSGSRLGLRIHLFVKGLGRFFTSCFWRPRWQLGYTP